MHQHPKSWRNLSWENHVYIYIPFIPATSATWLQLVFFYMFVAYKKTIDGRVPSLPIRQIDPSFWAFDWRIARTMLRCGGQVEDFCNFAFLVETNSKVLNTISIYIYVSIQCDVAWRVQQQHQTCIVALEDTPNLSSTDRQVSHIPLPLSLVARLQQFLQDVYRAPRKSSQNRWPEIPVDLFPGRFFTPNLEQTYIYWLRLNFPPPC